MNLVEKLNNNYIMGRSAGHKKNTFMNNEESKSGKKCYCKEIYCMNGNHFDKSEFSDEKIESLIRNHINKIYKKLR